MAIKVKKKLNIQVEFVTGLRGAYGETLKIDDETYIVRIRYHLKPLLGFLTWLHECGGHVGSYVYGNWVDERREHWFINGIEDAAKKLWRKHRGGGG